MEVGTILYGIVSETQMLIQINPDVMLPILRALQLSAYDQPLTQSLGKLRHQPNLSIQLVFRAMRDPHFISKITGISNGYSSADSVRLFKVALYLFSRCSLSLNDLSRFVSAIAHFQRRVVGDGVPKSVPVIKALLKEMNKFVPEPVIKLWLEKCDLYFRFKDVIPFYEFLFLVANCRDRSEAISALPYNQVSITPESLGTYLIDEIVNYPGHPDALLESLSAKTLALDRIQFLGNSELRVEEISEEESSSASEGDEGPNLEDFRKEISNAALKEQIKKVIEECQQKLNAAKLGGRLTFEERHSKSIGVSRLAKKVRQTQSAVNLSAIPKSRKSFFETTHFSSYIPPHILFPNRPKFRKLLPAKRLSESVFLKGRPFTATKTRTELRGSFFEQKSELTLSGEKTLDTLDLSLTSAKSVLHKRPPSGKGRGIQKDKLINV